MKSFQHWVSASLFAKRYALICGLICVAYFILLKINHRDGMSDFRVYYDAANALIHGDVVYGKSFGLSSGFYKYSPFAALPFIPLAVLPFSIACGIYYVLVMAAFVLFTLLLVYHLEKELGLKSKHLGWALALVTVFLLDHFERELLLGNVNIFLLIGAFAAYWSMQKGRVYLGGMIFGSILLFKPHFIVLLPYFVVIKQFRLLLSALVTIGIGLLLPMVIVGWNGNFNLIHQWLTAMADHNVQLEHSPNTVYGIFNHFVATPLGLEAGRMSILVLLGIVMVLFLALLRRNRNQAEKPFYTYFEYFLLIALIPNLAHTDTEHFMWTMPLIALAIILLQEKEIAQRWIYISLLALAWVPYCLNSPDIVGKPLALLFDEGGLLGMGNLVIIGVAVVLFLKFSKKPLAPQSH